MKSIALGLILCAGWIHAADETSDRQAIRRTVFRLNSFTADFDNDAELARIRTAPVLLQPLADRPGEVIISSEPWGEAEIFIPMPGVTFIAIKKIRFLTPETALVDAYAKMPVLFVLRKEAETWKIASIRILADL
jgi:hypothetical protein